MRVLLVVLSICGWTGALWAQSTGAVDSRSTHAQDAMEEAEEREHQPHHGGSFGDADDLYHYEVLLEAEHRLVLYVNDEHNRPLDVRALQGRWTLHPDATSPRAGVFTPTTDGAYFIATLPPTDDNPVHIEVAVLKGTVWAPMEFYLPRPAREPSLSPR